jgi:outer membrane protein OmpA-like peptidoglycan-associated protein
VLGGPTARELLTDAQGSANAEGLAPGSYEARVEADAYLVKLTRIAVTAGLVATPRIELQAKPEDAQVELTQSEVRIRQQVLFRTGSAEILEKSSALIDEIADVLLRNPQVRNIEVQGHTDSSGNADLNMALSQDRAEAVMRALIDRGVESTRLSAKGYGDTRPLAPNITAANRARNRRVQFVISQ